MNQTREGVEAVYDINDWIAADPDWQELVGGLHPENHTNIFYPVQQDPQGGFPYVRYSSRTDVRANTYWMFSDNIAYAMFFNNVTHSATAMNIIVDKVKGGDLSAAALNRWLASDNNDHEVLFEYHTLEFVGGGQTEPSGERGGAHARILTFSVDYTPLEGYRVRDF